MAPRTKLRRRYSESYSDYSDYESELDTLKEDEIVDSFKPSEQTPIVKSIIAPDVESYDFGVKDRRGRTIPSLRAYTGHRTNKEGQKRLIQRFLRDIYEFDEGHVYPVELVKSDYNLYFKEYIMPRFSNKFLLDADVNIKQARLYSCSICHQKYTKKCCNTDLKNDQVKTTNFYINIKKRE